ncbi:hypothetical protein [Salinispira pacifica]
MTSCPNLPIFVAPGEPPGRGVSFVDRLRNGTAHGRIVEYELPTRIAFRQTVKLLGMTIFESRPSYSFEREGDLTRVHHNAEGDGRRLVRLLEAAIRPVAMAERKRTIASLKRSFEIEAAAGPPTTQTADVGEARQVDLRQISSEPASGARL